MTPERDQALKLAHEDDHTGFWCDSRERNYQLLRRELRASEAEKDRMRQALEPFAEFWNKVPKWMQEAAEHNGELTVSGHRITSAPAVYFRKACDALAGTTPQPCTACAEKQEVIDETNRILQESLEGDGFNYMDDPLSRAMAVCIALADARKAGQPKPVAECHPEETCQNCHGPNVTWFADNETWNRVMGGDGGILCPICFVKRAEIKGIAEAWQLTIEGAATTYTEKDASIAAALQAESDLGAKLTSIHMEDSRKYRELLTAKQGEIDRLRKALNTPEIHDFTSGVVSEAQHQRGRWGSDHDAGKTPADWFWLLGYLSGKALACHLAGNIEKALHHTITAAAVLANWHAAVLGKTNMRPGIETPAGEAPDVRP